MGAIAYGWRSPEPLPNEWEYDEEEEQRACYTCGSSSTAEVFHLDQSITICANCGSDDS